MVALSAEYLGEPRFKVSVVHGRLEPGTGPKADGVTAIVVDRAYCCAVVAAFRSEDWISDGGYKSAPFRRGRDHTIPVAERHCAELNARHA